MIQLRIADRAQDDLLDIWLCVARDSLADADRSLKRLPGAVEIIRVLHGRRDLPEQLSDG